MRMSLVQFEQLLGIVGPLITKKYVIRIPIPAAARLAMTLRFLATGDCISSTTYSYLIGLTTAINIIHETCDALWTVLSNEVMPSRLTTDNWLKIAAEFKDQWNFEHCIGALDGKHIILECPSNAGSKYYNYKNHHSIILLAICDAKYLFTFVDIGACGRRSDGGVFKDSLMGQKFANKQMNLPKPVPLMADGNPLPYVLVADEAFQLSDYLLRPYSGRGLVNDDRRIFNYRLSRARRTIENTFGIVVSQWRILKKPMECSVQHTISIVKAIVCLHNWLRIHDYNNDYIPPIIEEESLRNEVENSALGDVSAYSNNNSTRLAMNIRDEFCAFYNGEGAVPWQYEIEL